MCVLTTIQRDNNCWKVACWTGTEVATDKHEYSDEKTAAVAALQLAALKRWTYYPDKQFVAVYRGRGLTEVVMVTLPQQMPKDDSEPKANINVIKRLGVDIGVVLPVSYKEGDKEALSLAGEHKVPFKPLFFEARFSVGPNF